LLNQELAGITGGLVPRATAVKKIMAFLVSRGVPVGETLDRFDVAELLIQDIDPVAKRVLQIRQEVGKSSVGKLQAMKHRVSSDGRIRGTLKFHGASSTGRWTSAGVQFQNLPRDSVKPPAVIDLIIDEDRDGVDLFSTRNVMPTISAALRNMIAPKPGRVLLVVDYAQIESRAVAYLADDQPKLDVFRQGRDIYKQVGSGMFGLPESEVVDDVRQASKVAELACFSADTRVITDSGIKQIVDVSTSDLLWDGESWIHHSGVLSRGLQHTISLQGVRVTQDHLVETGRTWSRAGLLASNPRHLHRALVTGLAGMWSLVTMSGPQVAWSMSSALATAGQPVTGWLFTTSGGVLVTSARSAPDGRRQTLVWNETDFQPSCRISNIDEGYPTDWPPQKTDAITPKTRALKTTEPEGYSSRMSGAGALRGLRLSSSMSLLLRGGMIPLLKWTVSMLMAGIARAISGSSLAQSTWLTSGLLKRCKAESCLLNRKSQTLEPVFDIWNAGPNHKFMILSDAGPLIVHNCGFGGGPGALAAMATNYGLDFTEDERVDLVKRWRDANQKAKKLWYELKDAAMSAMRNPGIPFQACRGKVAYEKVGNSLRCRLPSGRVIVYPWAEIKDVTAPWSTPEKPETIEAIIYEGISGSGQPVKKADTGKSTKWVKRAAWHGILCENVVQAMCSDLLREALVALERKGFKVIFHVHDEIVVETGADGAEAKLAEMIEVMTDVPLWATGMPIDAEGHVMARYGK
jgi:DNA polymerase